MNHSKYLTRLKFILQAYHPLQEHYLVIWCSNTRYVFIWFKLEALGKYKHFKVRACIKNNKIRYLININYIILVTDFKTGHSYLLKEVTKM